jgi:hypothetical protein
MPQQLLPTQCRRRSPGPRHSAGRLDGRLWCRPEAGCGTGTDSSDHVAVDTHDQPGSPCPGRERETCCSSCQPAGSKRAALAVRSDRCRPPASIKDHDVAQVASTDLYLRLLHDPSRVATVPADRRSRYGGISHSRSRWFEPNHAHSEPWLQVSAEFAHAEVAN